jgi:hypothetical protein
VYEKLNGAQNGHLSRRHPWGGLCDAFITRLREGGGHLELNMELGSLNICEQTMRNGSGLGSKRGSSEWNSSGQSHPTTSLVVNVKAQRDIKLRSWSVHPSG